MLPVLRSDALARVLAATFLSHEPLHVRALADRASLPYSTVQREVDRLEQAGVVSTQPRGGSRVVLVDERYPYLEELRALVLKAYGPTAVLADVLSEVPGVERVFIFGSWARRYEREWGSAPRDVDVLVVGSPSAEDVDDATAVAASRLGQQVQATIVSAEEWRAPASAFIRNVQAAPHVEVAVG